MKIPHRLVCICVFALSACAAARPAAPGTAAKLTHPATQFDFDLTADDSSVVFPTWSPEGYHLYEAALAGGYTRKIPVPRGIVPYHPRYSGDSKTIYFVGFNVQDVLEKNLGGGLFASYVDARLYSVDQSGKVRDLLGPAGNIRAITLSSDGEKLFFIGSEVRPLQEKIDDPYDSDLFEYTVSDGSLERAGLSFYGDLRGLEAAPDGKHLYMLIDYQVFKISLASVWGDQSYEYRDSMERPFRIGAGSDNAGFSLAPNGESIFFTQNDFYFPFRRMTTLKRYEIGQEKDLEVFSLPIPLGEEQSLLAATGLHRSEKIIAFCRSDDAAEGVFRLQEFERDGRLVRSFPIYAVM